MRSGSCEPAAPQHAANHRVEVAMRDENRIAFVRACTLQEDVRRRRSSRLGAAVVLDFGMIAGMPHDARHHGPDGHLHLDEWDFRRGQRRLFEQRIGNDLGFRKQLQRAVAGARREAREHRIQTLDQIEQLFGRSTLRIETGVLIRVDITAEAVMPGPRLQGYGRPPVADENDPRPRRYAISHLAC
jgi:hypothetical protein